MNQLFSVRLIANTETKYSPDKLKHQESCSFAEINPFQVQIKFATLDTFVPIVNTAPLKAKQLIMFEVHVEKYFFT